jgi:AcrR family transcriptional regulator
MSGEPVARIVDGLIAGKLSAADLSARGLGAFVGKTTGHVYHHWGSLSGLLFAVSKEGFRRLGELLVAVFREREDLADVAETFVAFGLQHPALYHVMFEYPYDWAELRERGLLDGPMPGLALWRTVAADIGAEQARLLYAGLHGLVSLAKSGRANIGESAQSDGDVARKSARALAEMLVSKQTRAAPPRSR